LLPDKGDFEQGDPRMNNETPVEHYEFVVPDDKHKERIDKFLSHQLPDISRSQVKHLIDEQWVRIDGEPVKANHLVRPGETISVLRPKVKKSRLEPENIPLDIIFEDNSLLVINKPAGMVVHPAYGNPSGTLVNALLYHCDSLAKRGGETRPGLVHRLDKDTSGLLVVAKTDAVHTSLAQELSDRKMTREYRALVWGELKRPEGKIVAPLARHNKDRTRMTIRQDGKHAVTHYEVLESFELISFLKLNLETGRTHQIRVHLASVGHPVLGDAVYGGRTKQLAGLNHTRTQTARQLLAHTPRQMLHAKTLSFFHPVENRIMRFDSDLPTDMKTILDVLKKSV
jgi:23S rRNA pseudouridine1911/1915/1917 synthase